MAAWLCLSAGIKRDAVAHVREDRGVSERGASSLAGVSRE
jgi:predicted transcriptional regulator